jgi:hypothetical protein
MEIDREGLYRNGVLSLGIGWQVPRLPGLGEVRWDRFLAALYAVGYDHVVSIEHEDRAFEGDDKLVKRGFLIARNALRAYSVSSVPVIRLGAMGKPDGTGSPTQGRPAAASRATRPCSRRSSAPGGVSELLAGVEQALRVEDAFDLGVELERARRPLAL